MLLFVLQGACAPEGATGMIQRKYFVETLRFLADVDDRPSGHFDHDAQNAAGPNLGEQAALHPSQKNARLDEGPTFESYTSASTGEVLYRRSNR